MADTEMKPEDTKKPGVVCPLCGAEGYTEEALPDMVKEAYLMSMLGDFPYSGRYPMMDGKIHITVASPTEKDKRLKLKFVVKIGDILASFPGLQTYTIALDQYIDAALQIRKIELNIPGIDTAEVIESEGTDTIKKLLETFPEKADENVLQGFMDSVYDQVFRGICRGKTIPMALLMAAVVKHNTLSNRLLKECLNENFIRGIGQ